MYLLRTHKDGLIHVAVIIVHLISVCVPQIIHVLTCISHSHYEYVHLYYICMSVHFIFSLSLSVCRTEARFRAFTNIFPLIHVYVLQYIT